MRRLENKVAVVTGGAGGIGLATAVRLADEGAYVFLYDRREADLEAAVGLLDGSATGVVGDTTVSADLDRLYAAVEARGQGLDVVFANAGMGILAPLSKVKVAQYEKVFDVNVRGTWKTVQKAVPHLNEGAAIILNSSIRAHDGWAEFGLVSASKAAILSLARTWANELKGQGVRVNSVSPGAIDTGAIDRTFGADRAADARREMAKGVPIGRLGRPEEVAAAVAFLAGSDSSFVLGGNLDIDGGEHQFRQVPSRADDDDCGVLWSGTPLVPSPPGSEPRPVVPRPADGGRARAGGESGEVGG